MDKKSYKPYALRPGAYVARMPETPKGANVIKRYRVNYTTKQKVRFGMLPYSALEEEMQAEALAEQEAAMAEEAAAESTDAADSDQPSKSENVNHTFWEDDDGERELLSADAYEKFLAENNINIGTAGEMPMFPN